MSALHAWKIIGGGGGYPGQSIRLVCRGGGSNGPSPNFSQAGCSMIITLRSTVRIAPHILPYFHFLAEKMFYSFAADALRLSPPPCPRVFRVLFPSRRQLERDQRVMRFVQTQEEKRHGIRQTFHSQSSFFSQSKTISTADV